LEVRPVSMDDAILSGAPDVAEALSVG